MLYVPVHDIMSHASSNSGVLMFRTALKLASLSSLIAFGACSKNASSPAGPNGALAVDAPIVLSLLPANATTGVDLTKPITITFNMSMMSGMEMLVVLHEGSVTGPQVAGNAAWSADRRVLTFTPAATLKAKTIYVVHFSPSLQGMNGKTINMAQGMNIGGQFVTGGMMGAASAGMMGGSWGSGMMGAGWKANDGTFGMQFTFTTA